MPLSRFRIADIHATAEERLANASEDTRDAALSIDEKLAGQKEVVAELGERIDNPKQVVRKLEEVKSAQLAGNIALKKIQARVYEDMKPVELLRTIKGDKGDKGDRGERGEAGPEGKSTVGPAGKDGKDGAQGKAGKDGSPDSPDEIIEKINKAKKKIQIGQIKGLSAILDELDKVGKFPMGGAVEYTTGGGNGITELPALTGAIDGSNTAFTFSRKPRYIYSDGVKHRENKGWTFADGTVTMLVAPAYDLFGEFSEIGYA